MPQEKQNINRVGAVYDLGAVDVGKSFAVLEKPKYKKRDLTVP